VTVNGYDEDEVTTAHTSMLPFPESGIVYTPRYSFFSSNYNMS